MKHAVLAIAERRELADLLASLSPAQWSAPSLCARWSVRDVAVHVVSYDELPPQVLAESLVRGALSVDRVNEQRIRAYDHLSPADVVELIRQHARPQGLTAGFGGAIAVTDGLIHQQDIRRPLGLPRSIPHDRLRLALDFAHKAPTIRGFWTVRGLRMTATDLDWSVGDGPEVRGPGEAVLMAMAGRRHALHDLTGPGLPLLGSRLP